MPAFNHKRFFPLLLLLITFVVSFSILFYQYRDFEIAVKDAAVNAIVFSICNIAANAITKKYPTHVAAIIYSIIIGVLTGFVSYSISGMLLPLFFETDLIEMFLSDSNLTRLLLHILGACWIISLTTMKKKNEDLEEKMTHIADAVTLRKEAELFKLRQQLQPHFLYNSLNSINALILTFPEQAQEMVGKLSEFLRASVKRDANVSILLTEELQYIETYLAIESVRFGDRLQVVYKKEFNQQATIPPFILQPILENAIKFGLYGTTGIVTITIEIRQEQDFLHLQIENPYEVLSKPTTGTGFGLEGISRRLYLLYGRNDLLTTDSSNGTFITQLKLPQ